MSDREVFERRCFLLGLTGKEQVAELWAGEQKKAAAAKSTRRDRRGRPDRPRR